MTEIGYPRFTWLLPSRVAGAPHPDLFGGLPALAPFLRGKGVSCVVSLCERPLEPDPEAMGFRYLFVQTPDFRPPPDLSLILDFMGLDVNEGRGALVHCFAGIGRTGTVLAAWLLRVNPAMSAGEAVSCVREKYIPEYARDRFPEHPSQMDALERFALTR